MTSTSPSNPVIPAQAVEAAISALLPDSDIDSLKGGFWWGNVETILAAAAPHMLAGRKLLADVLATHQQKVGIRDMRSHCWCGWSGEMTGRAFIEHQADAILSASHRSAK